MACLTQIPNAYCQHHTGKWRIVRVKNASHTSFSFGRLDFTSSLIWIDIGEVECASLLNAHE